MEGMSSLKLMAQQAVEKSQQEQPQETCDAMIPPILGVAPLGTVALTKEQQYQFQLLENAYYRCLPHPADTERMPRSMPRNPAKTPLYYIQVWLFGVFFFFWCLFMDFFFFFCETDSSSWFRFGRILPTAFDWNVVFHILLYGGDEGAVPVRESAQKTKLEVPYKVYDVVSTAWRA